MLNERKITFVLNNLDSIYLGYTSQMSMLPVKVVKYKNIYVKQAKLSNYYPSNTICRETMIAYVIMQLSKNPHKHIIDMLMIIPKGYKDKLNKGIKLVNHYEKLLGWNKTYTHEVDKIICKTDKIEKAYKKHSFTLVTIPGKWLYSPQLLSLYLMFLKIAEIGFECEFKTHKELMNQLDAFFIRQQTHLKTYPIDGFMGTFCQRIRLSYKYWDIFLHNLDTLFKNKTRKFNYNIDKHLEKLYNRQNDYKMHLDGISNLIDNHTYDKQLGKSFNALKKANE